LQYSSRKQDSLAGNNVEERKSREDADNRGGVPAFKDTPLTTLTLLKWRDACTFDFSGVLLLCGHLCFCAAPCVCCADCQNAVMSMQDQLGVAQDIFCRCGNAFCFNCKEEAHRPVDCDTVRKWMVRGLTLLDGVACGFMHYSAGSPAHSAVSIGGLCSCGCWPGRLPGSTLDFNIVHWQSGHSALSFCRSRTALRARTSIGSWPTPSPAPSAREWRPGRPALAC
jgi:hypothetical protein